MRAPPPTSIATCGEAARAALYGVCEDDPPLDWDESGGMGPPPLSWDNKREYPYRTDADE